MGTGSVGSGGVRTRCDTGGRVGVDVGGKTGSRAVGDGDGGVGADRERGRGVHPQSSWVSSHSTPWVPYPRSVRTESFVKRGVIVQGTGCRITGGSGSPGRASGGSFTSVGSGRKGTPGNSVHGDPPDRDVGPSETSDRVRLSVDGVSDSNSPSGVVVGEVGTVSGPEGAGPRRGVTGVDDSSPGRGSRDSGTTRGRPAPRG